VIDAALIAFFYGTLSGFLHGAVLSRAQGSEIQRYLELARPFFAGFITNAVNETGDRIAAGNYGDAQSSMRTIWAASIYSSSARVVRPGSTTW
jgi:NADPH-dependent reductive aminase-like, C-terminal domain